MTDIGVPHDSREVVGGRVVLDHDNVVAVLEAQRGYVLLQRVRHRSPADATPPPRVGELERRVGKLRALRVIAVGECARAPRDPDPAILRVAELWRDTVEDVLRQVGQQPLLGDRADRPGLLGEEHVGGGVRPLLHQRRGEVAGLGEAHLHVAVGGLLVDVDRAADRGGDPAGIQRDSLGLGLGRTASGVLGGGTAGAESQARERKQRHRYLSRGRH